VEEQHLAAALTDRELLLWLGFAPDGALCWTAFRRDEARLRVVACDEGQGPRDAQQRLRWLADWHDFQSELTWALGSFLPAGAPPDLRRPLGQVGRALNGQGSLASLPSSLNRLGDLLERKHGARGNRNELLLLGARLLTRPADAAAADDWRRRTAEQWSLLAPARDARTAEGLQAALDRQTDHFVRQAGAVLALEALAEHLTPETDLVVQAAGALYAVPFAHLPLGDGPLFQKVRSVRSVRSVLGTAPHPEGHARGRPDPAPATELAWRGVGGDPGGEGDPPRHATFWVADLPGAGGEGGGVLGVLLRHDLPRQDPPGDLSGVELLVLCPVGRLGPTGQRDAYGLCLGLALSRARSVLAARWSVPWGRAPAFADAVLRHYLDLRRREGGPTPENCLRARALNRGRAEALRDQAAGLHAAAAFELYGLG
jgi:hypothetical protein